MELQDVILFGSAKESWFQIQPLSECGTEFIFMSGPGLVLGQAERPVLSSDCLLVAAVH